MLHDKYKHNGINQLQLKMKTGILDYIQLIRWLIHSKISHRNFSVEYICESNSFSPAINTPSISDQSYTGGSA